MNLNKIFAQSGDTSVIPDDSMDGELSMLTGFTLDYALPTTDANVKYLEYKQFNSILKQITLDIREQLVSGIPPYMEEAVPSGGVYIYAKDAVVTYNSGIYLSLKDDNNDRPDVPTSWKVISVDLAQLGDASPNKALSAAAFNEFYVTASDTKINGKTLLSGNNVVLTPLDIMEYTDEVDSIDLDTLLDRAVYIDTTLHLRIEVITIDEGTRKLIRQNVESIAENTRKSRVGVEFLNGTVTWEDWVNGN